MKAICDQACVVPIKHLHDDVILSNWMGKHQESGVVNRAVDWEEGDHVVCMYNRPPVFITGG